MSFIIEALLKILAAIGLYQVGRWTITKSSSTGSGSGGSTGGGGGGGSSPPTLVGTAHLWAIAVMVVGGAIVVDQYLKDRGARL